MTEVDIIKLLFRVRHLHQLRIHMEANSLHLTDSQVIHSMPALILLSKELILHPNSGIQSMDNSILNIRQPTLPCLPRIITQTTRRRCTSSHSRRTMPSLLIRNRLNRPTVRVIPRQRRHRSLALHRNSGQAIPKLTRASLNIAVVDAAAGVTMIEVDLKVS